jgi:hypothetical protein
MGFSKTMKPAWAGFGLGINQRARIVRHPTGAAAPPRTKQAAPEPGHFRATAGAFDAELKAPCALGKQGGRPCLFGPRCGREFNAKEKIRPRPGA